MLTRARFPPFLVASQVNPEDRRSSAFNYERCVRYNYSTAERSMLVDVATMIKSLAAQLRRSETRLAPLVRASNTHIFLFSLSRPGVGALSPCLPSVQP